MAGSLCRCNHLQLLIPGPVNRNFILKYEVHDGFQPQAQSNTGQETIAYVHSELSPGEKQQEPVRMFQVSHTQGIQPLARSSGRWMMYWEVFSLIYLRGITRRQSYAFRNCGIQGSYAPGGLTSALL